MKQRLWLSVITALAYCVDKELYKAIDYLREQVRVLIEHQEQRNKRILLSNKQRARVASKAKRLNRKMLEQCTDLFTPDTVMPQGVLCSSETPARRTVYASGCESSNRHRRGLSDR